MEAALSGNVCALFLIPLQSAFLSAFHSLALFYQFFKNQHGILYLRGPAAPLLNPGLLTGWGD